MTLPEPASLRIDKWLWSVRLFKTRSLATDACKSGKVKCNGLAVKASREIHAGDVYEVNTGLIRKKVRVISLLSSRVGAKLVPEYLEDLTPAEEYERLQMLKEYNYEQRDRGIGRPTKKDRRNIHKLKGMPK